MWRNELSADSASRFDAPKKQPTVFDARALGNDPRVQAYLGRPCLVEVPLATGRGLCFFPFTKHGHHPFVRAIEAELEAAGTLEAVLDSYFRAVNPNSFAEWFGLSVGLPGAETLPAWAGPYPWSPFTPEQVHRWLAEVTLKENETYGESLAADHGIVFFGPTDQRKVAIEAHRLMKLLRSIVANGYARSDDPGGDTEGVVLVNDSAADSERRWMCTRGQHRAAVATAVGIDSIPIRVRVVVRRSEVESWPAVLDGTFVADDALRVFDRIFDGDPPRVFDDWLRSHGKKPTAG